MPGIPYRLLPVSILTRMQEFPTEQLYIPKEYSASHPRRQIV
jgi:hypothetical protein